MKTKNETINLLLQEHNLYFENGVPDDLDPYLRGYLDGYATQHPNSLWPDSASPALRIGIQTYIINRDAPKLKPIFQEMVDTCYLLTDSLNNNHSVIRNTLYRLDSATDFINSKGMQQEYMEYEENFLTDRYRELEQIAEPNDMEQLKTDNTANAN